MGSGCPAVFVDHAAQNASPPYRRVDRDDHAQVVVGRVLIQALMWAVSVEAVLALILCVIVVRVCTTPIWISRANTWASGRYSNVDASSWSRWDSAVIALPTLVLRLRWVSMQPLGRPVAPLV